jgi:hypothetical protein
MEKEIAGFEFNDVHVMFARFTVAATMAISSSDEIASPLHLPNIFQVVLSMKHQ